MSDIDLDELERLAKAATWVRGGITAINCSPISLASLEKFIAAANPQTVLRLIEMARKSINPEGQTK